MVPAHSPKSKTVRPTAERSDLRGAWGRAATTRHARHRDHEPRLQRSAHAHPKMVGERVQGGAPGRRGDRAPLRLAPEDAVTPAPATMAPAGPSMARSARHLLWRPRPGNHGRHVEAHGARPSQAWPHLRSGSRLDAGALGHHMAKPCKEGEKPGERQTSSAPPSGAGRSGTAADLQERSDWRSLLTRGTGGDRKSWHGQNAAAPVPSL